MWSGYIGLKLCVALEKVPKFVGGSSKIIMNVDLPAGVTLPSWSGFSMQQET